MGMLDSRLKRIEAFLERRNYVLDGGIRPSADRDTKIVFLVDGASDQSVDCGRELEKRFDIDLVVLRSRGSPHDRVSPSMPQTSSRYRWIQLGPWLLDVKHHELIGADGSPVPLTTGEFDLLQEFMVHPRQVLSRDHLMQSTRNIAPGPHDRSIDMQVRRLRKKLGDRGPNFRLIKTSRCEGYMLVADVEPVARSSDLPSRPDLFAASPQ